MFLTPTKKKKKKRFCFRLKKKRDFDFENAVKSKAVKPKMPTLTPKISDLLFMTWHSWKEVRKPKPKSCSHAGTICPLQFKSFSCCSCIYIYIYFGWIKRMRKILLLLLKTCTCSALMHRYWRERVLKAKRWEIRKKVNEETGTELLIIQGVDVRFQNIWQVEYQRVNRGVLGFVPDPEPTRISRVG